MKVSEFKSQVESSFHNSFPNGYLRFGIGALGKDTLFISYGLICDIEDVSNKIRENDPMHNTMVLFDFIGNDDTILTKDGKICIEGGAARLSTKPEEGSYLAMNHLNLKFRKITNTPEKTLKSLDNYFKKVKKIVNENKENIYNVKNIPAKYLD